MGYCLFVNPFVVDLSSACPALMLVNVCKCIRGAFMKFVVTYMLVIKVTPSRLLQTLIADRLARTSKCDVARREYASGGREGHPFVWSSEHKLITTAQPFHCESNGLGVPPHSQFKRDD